MVPCCGQRVAQGGLGLSEVDGRHRLLRQRERFSRQLRTGDRLAAIREGSRPGDPPQDLGFDVVLARERLGRLGQRLRCVVAALQRNDIGELAHHGRPEIRLPQALEVLIVPPEKRLGSAEIPRQDLDTGGIDRGRVCDRAGTQVQQQSPGPLRHLASVVEAALHGAKLCEHAEDQALGLAVPADLIEERATSLGDFGRGP